MAVCSRNRATGPTRCPKPISRLWWAVQRRRHTTDGKEPIRALRSINPPIFTLCLPNVAIQVTPIKHKVNYEIFKRKFLSASDDFNHSPALIFTRKRKRLYEIFSHLVLIYRVRPLSVVFFKYKKHDEILKNYK